MSQQTIRQQARAAARDMAQKRRRERVERDRRLEDLAVQVLTAIGERDVAVAAAEQRAGASLREMTEAESLTLRDAVAWCDEQVSLREATRLRRLAVGDGSAMGAGPAAVTPGDGPGDGSGDGDDGAAQATR